MIVIKKTIYVISVILLFAAAICGVKIIYSDAKNAEDNANVLYATAENRITGVKINEKVQNVAKNKVEELLGAGVKSNVSEISSKGDRIICYMKNVYMELDTLCMRPVLLFYECPKGEPVISEEQCRQRAVSFALRNAPRKTKINGFTVEKIDSERRIFAYKISLGDKKVVVGVRGDTGSIIYYNASELFET